MSDDVFEARLTSYVNLPRVTHKVMLDGKPIGRVWDNGAIEIDEPSDVPEEAVCAMCGSCCDACDGQCGTGGEA